jgi:hypothetical protein
MLAETKEKIDLKTLRNYLLSEHKFVHLCFHTKEELLYELYLPGKKLLHNKNAEHEIDLVSYHLKRFLLIDGGASIQAVN